MNNVQVKFQLHTGSDITIIVEKTFEKIGKPGLMKANKVTQGVTDE